MLIIKKHRQVMFDIISAIYRSPLGDVLGFKGGTMAYFFYGLDRFSVDLDFDLFDESSKEEIKSIMPSILSKYGSLQDSQDKYYTIFYLLSYQKGMRTIKIEISKRKTTDTHYDLANFYGVDVLILSESDAFATKLLACTERNRTAYRDFYDVYFYLKKGVQPNITLIENVTKKSFKKYINHLLKFTQKNISSRTILHGLGELVNEKQKVWIKNNLKIELVRRLEFLADSIPVQAPPRTAKTQILKTKR